LAETEVLSSPASFPSVGQSALIGDIGMIRAVDASTL
jgi:hypothetical protein